MTIKVIIADDHAVLRDGLRVLLDAQPGIKVVGDTGDGRSAVRLVGELRPHVVVMDMAMPEMNGIEAACQIKERYPAVHVVMLSMHSKSEYIYRAFEAGALGYVLKESAGKDVGDAVRAVCRGRRYLSQKVTDVVVDDRLRRRKDESTTPLDSLSPREREVLQLVVEGKASKEIADMVHLSPKSVETYRSRLMLKLGIHNIPDLVKFAIEHGLTTCRTNPHELRREQVPSRRSRPRPAAATAPHE